MKNKTIKVDYLARVEGEGALYIKIKNNEVSEVELRIFEPPRFFEAFLRGRPYQEAPDITARICGICPVAYQMSAVHAMENAFGVTISPEIKELRRLLYCGEWIESHTLHLYMLHAPDFLGYDDVVQMSKDHPEIVKKALKLKKIGNDIMNLVGGREIHPINVKVGGFFKVPTRKDLMKMYDDINWARDAAVETARFAATLKFPEFVQDYECVSLVHPFEYPFNEGRIMSNKGIDILPEQYDFHFREEHVEHSHALHSRIRERDNYLVGPIARYNLNYDKLTPLCKEIAEEVGLSSECYNPFKSIIIRGIETIYSCEEALRIIESYRMPDSPAVKVEPSEATGYACTEAPRGMIYHRYRVNSEGLIEDAKIVPPTSQNQRTIENDLRTFVPSIVDLPEKELIWKCEQVIRNYDPCISCATHFLKLDIHRE
ncbi:MAG: Ni/Fe hydrogenase subunit alpha [Ignavibacteria bacterium]|nr:Ni/Fe hydrogenase subunit alpha [Ignavibacteria bacterium]MCC7158072.1 Ni/Fe hydrogenase subunit alpha [Ignavibacteria bacterium]